MKGKSINKEENEGEDDFPEGSRGEVSVLRWKKREAAASNKTTFYTFFFHPVFSKHPQQPDTRFMSSLPWLVCGDFNCILSQSEKRGGPPYSSNLINGFLSVLNDTGLHEITLYDFEFMWNNGRGEGAMVEEKIDQFFASESWRQQFNLSRAETISYSSSDHLSIFLQIQTYVPRDRVHLFRFENQWTEEEECRSIVDSCWKSKALRPVQSRLDVCRNRLDNWKRNLKRIYAQGLQRETYWKQRANGQRLRGGDQNTRFFHMKATARQRKNQFVHDSMELSSLIPIGVMEEDNHSLLAPYTSEEIQQAIFSMQSDKSPGHCFDPQEEDAGNYGRLTADYFVSAYEVLNYMRSRRRGKDGYVALKIDIRKAYDRLEWPFIRFMLQSLGFDAKFIDLVMFCVSTMSYQVLHQGQLLGPIAPQRGVRQGDPPSPYLFILCVEGLSYMIRAQVATNALHSCIIATDVPQITHLFLADDNLLFFKVEISEAQIVQEVLDFYARMSGQVINFNKSIICYSANVPASRRVAIYELLHIVEGDGIGNYLGLPMNVGRNKAEVFHFLKDKVWKRLNSWSHRSLWHGFGGVKGKIMTKACIGCLGLARPKIGGDLSFKKLREFNLAMLGRVGWNLILNPHSLVASLLKAHYYPIVFFLDAPKGTNPSFVWTSIRASQGLLRQRILWRIGSDSMVPIWLEPWLPDRENPFITSYFETSVGVHYVSDLIQNGT
ncbi:uncharacterized protein LOC110612607 [Manihot esculenta]|uniref:uncharacterized protein LOC110612607 n=1 Tax=Manihot esculenta TaxID=3983 RepID=UPI000B5D3515|nr:uncharacterized protein LOC110612607 [Manihot esculenta]